MQIPLQKSVRIFIDTVVIMGATVEVASAKPTEGTCNLMGTFCI